MAIVTQLFQNNLLGLDQRTIERSQSARSCVDCDGVILSADGGISVIPGREITITGLTNPGILMEHISSAYIKTKLIYTDDGVNATVYQWNEDGTYSSINPGGGLVGGGYIDWINFQGVFFLVSSKFAPQKWTGSGTLSAVGGWPPTYSTETPTTINPDLNGITPGAYPDLVTTHANRLWLGFRSGSRVHYSGSLAYETWTNSATGITRAGAFDVWSAGDDDGALTGIFSWQSYLVVFKNRKTYLISGDSPLSVSGTSPFTIQPAVYPYGTLSPRSVSFIDNDLIFVDQNGYVRSLLATMTSAQQEAYNLSYKIQPELNKIPQRALKYVSLGHYVKRNSLWMTCHKGASEHSKDSNTRALYHLDGLTDLSGNARTLTNTGTATFGLGFNNFIQDCAILNGSSQRLSHTSAIGAALTEVTFSAWVKPSSLPTSGNKAYVLHVNHTSGTLDLYLHNDSGTQYVKGSVTDTGGTERVAYKQTSLSTTTWSHLVCVWNGTTVRLFVNGVEGTSVACTSIQVSGSDGLAIGSSSASSNANLFTGSIDEVRVLDTDLASSDILNYNDTVSTGNNKILIYDYAKIDPQSQTGALAKAWVKATDIIKAASIYYDDITQSLYTSTYDGKIHKQDTGTTHGLSRRVSFYTQSWVDSGKKYAHNNKQAKQLILWVTAMTAGTLNIDYSWDNRHGGIIPIVFDPSAEGVWGDDWTTELIWSSGTGRKLYKYEIRPSGHGKLFQFKLYSWTEGFQWTVVDWFIEWDIKGTQS